ncbi:MAG: dTMP kinase [Anaerococcus sp.]|jgi:dTMP kinase|nr:dTMP kinase [Peptoniphilaceae bacterium]MDY3055300.1 dTMP kinase [Anaerococcus sp.]
MKSKFIVFEGPDGSGKSTILKKVKESLIEEGHEIYDFREPGGTPISEKIRNIILDNDNAEMTARCEALLYAASRAQLLEEKIKPLLDRGAIVLCDRFVLSSLMYQGIGRDLGIEQVKAINDFAIGQTKPDLTIFFNIDYKTAIDRKRKNFESDRLENEEDDFHRRIFDGYIDLSKKYKDQIVTVDATQSIDQVTKDCLSIIKNSLEG